MRRSRIIGLVVIGASILIPFGTATVDCVGDTVPNGLPPWVQKLDTDKDGQISLEEWRKGGKMQAEFRQYDLNHDGFITTEELLRLVEKRDHLQLKNGQANYRGTLNEARDATYQGKKAFKILPIKLERGKTYHIEQLSQAYYAYLYLEGPNGDILDQNDSGGRGRTARIVHRAARSGTYRIIATSQGGFRTGSFVLSIRVVSPFAGLPPWFHKLDRDKDGQISLEEWQQGGKRPAEFRQYDPNGDGLITAEEVLKLVKKESRLELKDDRVNYRGVIEETKTGGYRGKRSFKILPIKLERGKTYQIEQLSQAYFAYLYLEDPDGAILDQNDSGGRGRTARIVHRAARSGTYRIIATSQGGFRIGPFSLSISVVRGSIALPAWFKELDTDHDGQVSFQEWRQGGRRPEDFRQYDLNGDNFITAEEVLKIVKNNPLELQHGQANYRGAIEGTSGKPYQGKRAFQIIPIKLERGKTYHIEQLSQAYYAYLYLEGPNGDILDQNDSGGRGRTARIVHRAARSGTYRIIATSQGGFRTGPFSLSVRAVSPLAGILPQELPSWFQELDTDQDGQISLQEWCQGGQSPAAFGQYDLNNDGFIAADEIARFLQRHSPAGSRGPRGPAVGRDGFPRGSAAGRNR